nr:HNH endonuclease family protein [Novosphingopyxis iocasae]
MVSNRNILRQTLSSLDNNVRAGLLPFIAQRCYLVVVEASDQASAYRIFSVMNDRGLDLSATDILKADVVGAIESEEEQARYNDVWESLEDGLGREAFGDLFAHLRMIHRRQKMRGTLEKEFKNYVQPVERPIEFIGQELKSSAEAFKKILEPDSSKNSKRYRLLKGLHQIDNQDWQPALIKFMVDRFGQEDEIDKFLERLDRLAYFLFITRANINQRLQRYGLLIEEIAEEASVEDITALNLSEFEVESLFDWLDDDIYLNQRTRRAILLRLDEMLSDGTAHYDHRILTIEHVLPQNPGANSDWIRKFPSKSYRDHWVHTLANLVLLSKYKNPAASNYDFEKKKGAYFSNDGDSAFVLTNQVRELDDWTPEILEERRERLLRKISEKWSLDFPDEWY